MSRNVAADLATVLEAAGLSLNRQPAAGANLYLGPLPAEHDDATAAADVPAKCVAIIQTGGPAPLAFVGQGRESFRTVVCLIHVRSPITDFEAGQTLAFGVYDALHLKDSSPYVTIKCRESAPQYWAPRDAADRHYWTVNVEASFLDAGV